MLNHTNQIGCVSLHAFSIMYHESWADLDRGFGG